jgi:hypothetical protein
MMGGCLRAVAIMGRSQESGVRSQNEKPFAANGMNPFAGQFFVVSGSFLIVGKQAMMRRRRLVGIRIPRANMRGSQESGVRSQESE